MNEVTVHVKAEGHPDRDVDIMARRAEGSAKRSFLRTGGHAGAAFAAGFIKTITLGQVGSGFAMAATKMAPQMAHLGGALGVTLAAALAVKLAKSLSALLPLALGAGALALPIAGIIKKQLAGMQDLNKLNDKIAAQENKVANSKGKQRQEAEKELAIMKKQRAELEKQVKPLLTLQDKAKRFMAEISKPVKQPLFKSFKLVGDALDEWGPKFRKAIGPLAKELPGFVKGALKGIENFAEEIGKKMPSITKGFRQWGKELPGIGKALGKMLAAWIEDGPRVAEGVADTAKSFKDLAKWVGSVGKGFKGFNKINADFVEMMEGQRRVVLKFRISMLKALIAVADAWGLLSPAGRRAAASLRKSLQGAEKELDKTDRKLQKIADKKVVTKLKADKRDSEAKIRDIDRKLQKTHDKKVISKLKADKSQAEANIRRITGLLNQLNGKEAVTWIRTHRVTYYGTKGKPPTNPKGRASGGNIGAATGGDRGGQVWVGEEGPELVDLPYGSHVNSNPDSMAKASKGRSGGGPHLHFHFDRYTGSTTDLIKDLVNAKKRGQLDVLFR